MVVHSHYPLGEPRVQREARAAHEAGFEVHVLSLRGSNESPHETIDGIVVHRAPLSHRRGGSLAMILVEYVAFCVYATAWLGWATLRKPFGIIHVHNPPDFLIVSSVLPRLRGAKTILDVHDLSSHMFGVRIVGATGRVVSRALVLVERLAGRFADRVITVHEPYRAELVRHGIDASKIEVVMNAVDDVVLARAASRGAAISPPDTRFRIAYHGTLTHWYGADLLVEALAAMRDRGLDAGALIIGAGDAVPDLRARVAALDLGEWVRLTGRYLPIEKALATVKGADCGVIPNRPSEINRFALSSKLFEYVALDIPVVVARLLTLNEHFTDDEVTFFEPGDPTSLAAALSWVATNPESARAKALQAKRRAEAYSWPASRSALLGLYADLTDAPVPGLRLTPVKGRHPPGSG